MTIPKFKDTILSWYKENKRDLPWRNTRDPYAILVSEVMLHQTQVSRVIEKYDEFLQAFPTIEELAKTPEKKLLLVWKGLGYWRRALYLKETAKILANKPFPKDVATLETLPGIGPYTARALTCFAFQDSEAFIDTNIRRVYLHFFFQRKDNVSDKDIEKIAQKAVVKENPREWHYALFDYGALVLKDRTINKRSRHYQKQSVFDGSFRLFRSKTLQHLLSHNKVLKNSLTTFLRKECGNTPHSAKEIIDSLLKDKLIKEKGNFYTI